MTHYRLMLFQIKSMGEHLSRIDKLHAGRRNRFPGQFTEDVTALFTMITRDVIDRYMRVGIASVRCL